METHGTTARGSRGLQLIQASQATAPAPWYPREVPASQIRTGERGPVPQTDLQVSLAFFFLILFSRHQREDAFKGLRSFFIYKNTEQKVDRHMVLMINHAFHLHLFFYPTG